MTEHRSLNARFVEHFRALDLAAERVRLLVAVSGGCDSMVLLYLLRHCRGSLPLELVVAHLDHGMRPESAADARWLSGVCTAWDLPLVTRRLARAPRGETEARSARYAFLHAAARDRDARFVVTGHHADDQAETVLFRALRGTGLAGLAGMRPISRAGVVRPLLPFWRRELVAFAERNRIPWREDATNRSRDPTRNRIRHELLPIAEAAVAPGARANLVSLARLAHEAESALEREASRAVGEIARIEGEDLLLARSKLRAYHSATASRVVRKALRRFGIVPGGTGTRRALQFITGAPSGRVLELPDGVRVRLEFDVARITRDAPATADEPLVFRAPRPGEEIEREIALGGRRYRVKVEIGAWDPREAGAIGSSRVALPLAVGFPCSLRAWLPGDRLRTSGGTKTLKKLFLERRIPRWERHRLPVLADPTGRVLWVGGVGMIPERAPEPGEPALVISIADA